MTESIILYAVYLLIIAVVIMSLVICYRKQNAASFTFCGSMVTLLVVVLLSTLPVRNKITSPGLSIEPRLDQIEYKQKELSSVVSALSELQAIAFGSSLTDGGARRERKKVEASIKVLEPYLTSDTLAKLKNGFGLK